MCGRQRARPSSCLGVFRSKFRKSTFCINSCETIHSFCETHTNASIFNCHHNSNFVICLCTTESTCMAVVFSIKTHFCFSRSEHEKSLSINWFFLICYLIVIREEKWTQKCKMCVGRKCDIFIRNSEKYI